MKLSDYFISTTKNITLEAKLESHKLMLKSGLIKQIASGIYCWLPLGLRVLNKLTKLIREELDLSGCQEVLLPSLQPISLWKKSGRAKEESEMKSQMFHLEHSKGAQYILPPSGEEGMTELFGKSIHSYKEVSKILYQISWKFRNEIRPRHGVMRAKEFLMKDAYSFNCSKGEALQSYEKIFKLYLKLFERIGIEVIPVAAPVGAMGGDYSHEFHVLSKNGESTIYYQSGIREFLKKDNFTLRDFEKFYAKEQEKYNEDSNKPLDLIKSSSIEVAHLFYLGQKYSKSLNCKYNDSQGKLAFIEMGCYGIGITRLIAAIIESNHDSKGIVWPNSLISPFQIAVINIKNNDALCIEASDRIYSLFNKKYDVLYDDTDKSVGRKFADTDLIGCNIQIIVGNKYIANSLFEVKIRRTDEIHFIHVNDIESAMHGFI